MKSKETTDASVITLTGLRNHGSHTHGAPHSHRHPMPQNYVSAGGGMMTGTVEIEQEDLHPEIDVDVEKGYYKITKRTEDGKEEVVMPVIDSHESYEGYAMNLKADQLVAGTKIFYDRWNFVTGSEQDKRLFKACESELERRREMEGFALHSHQLPAHSHSFSVGTPACGLPNNYSVGYTSYNGGHSHSFQIGGEHTHHFVAAHDMRPPWLISAG